MSTSSFEKDQRPGIAPAVDAGVVRMNRAVHPGGAVSNQTGTVKWFNLHKGFGFIRPSTGGGDVFVHISALEKVGLYALEERQPVAFDLEEDPESGRMSAVNLKILG